MWLQPDNINLDIHLLKYCVTIYGYLVKHTVCKFIIIFCPTSTYFPHIINLFLRLYIFFIVFLAELMFFLISFSCPLNLHFREHNISSLRSVPISHLFSSTLKRKLNALFAFVCVFASTISVCIYSFYSPGSGNSIYSTLVQLKTNV